MIHFYFRIHSKGYPKACTGSTPVVSTIQQGKHTNRECSLEGGEGCRGEGDPDEALEVGNGFVGAVREDANGGNAEVLRAFQVEANVVEKDGFVRGDLEAFERAHIEGGVRFARKSPIISLRASSAHGESEAYRRPSMADSIKASKRLFKRASGAPAAPGWRAAWAREAERRAAVTGPTRGVVDGGGAPGTWKLLVRAATTKRPDSAEGASVQLAQWRETEKANSTHAGGR